MTINAHNRLLDVTCHRNSETTYLKDLEEGAGGASSRRLLLRFCFIVLSEFRYTKISFLSVVLKRSIDSCLL
jgi:hypothetical protein